MSHNCDSLTGIGCESHFEGGVTTSADFLTVFLPVLLWLLYVFICYRFHQPMLRILALAVGLLILLLPMHDLVFWVISLAHASVLVHAALSKEGMTA